ncbi:hypothetical protein KDV93_22415 [Serratia ureilytica]|uniref:hypothetical protein n=1 Tax=Serratia ureilytica TaxID=300181 RepID=UPI00332F4A5B
MLDNHSARTVEEKNRVAVVAAALEILKASAASSSAHTGRDKLEKDAKWAAENIGHLADAIEAAINKRL